MVVAVQKAKALLDLILFLMFSLRGSTGLLRGCLRTPPVAPQLRTYATDNGIRKKAGGPKPKSLVNEALARTTALFKTYKPVSPGIRHLKRPINEHLFEGRPIRILTVAMRKNGGRNNSGRITVRSRGGGHKRRIRKIDFRRENGGLHDVVRIEYDPGRSAHIALIKNRDATKEGLDKWSYILAPEGLRAGDTVQSFRQGIPQGFVEGYDDSPEERAKAIAADARSRSLGELTTGSLSLGILRAATVKPGNVLPLRLIPTGTIIHNICLDPRGHGILVRSAGSFGQVVRHEEAGKYVQVRLQSGEVRQVLQGCCATVGKVSNPLWKFRNLGKAGRSRWLGRRPHVRGMAMNANDHPHGGGRGKSKGNKHPRSVWGWLAKGKRTRKPGPKGPNGSNMRVISERPRGAEKRAS